MGETPAPDSNAQVSHEIDGRVLTGVGGTPEALDTLQGRYAPESEPAGEGTPVAPADGKPASEAPAQTSEKPSRGRQRFADLTREREEARQEAAAAKAERDAISRERDELRARFAQPAAPPTPQERPAPQYTRAKPSVDDVGTKYQTYEDFTEDLADWKTEQRLATELDTRIGSRIEADRANRDFLATVERTRDAGRKAYADFDAQLTGGPGALVPLGPTPAEAMQRAAWVIQHPQSAHIQYAILKDGDLARRLQQMDPVSFGHAIASLAPSGSGAQLASPARTGSVTPPAPFQPVGSGSKTTTPSSAELVKGGFDFDKSGYRERRAAERGVRRR